MPTYEVTVDGEAYEVESDRDLTDDEAAEAALASVPGATEQPGIVERYAPLAARVVSGGVAGVVGAVPSPVTTPLAALIGGGGEVAAQALERASGQREDFNVGSIVAEAGLSALPFGAAKGVTRLARAGQTAAKAAVTEAAGAQVRALAGQERFATPGETALAAVGGGVAGGLAGALTRAPKVPKTIGEAGEVAEEVAEETGRAAGARTKGEALQLGLFDDGGHVRPEVAEPLGPTVTGASTAATGAVADAVKREGKEAAAILAATEAGKADSRLYLQIAESFDKGDISAPDLVRELSENGLSMSEWVHDFYRPTIRRAGRQLNQLSQVRTYLESVADPATKGLLEDLSREAAGNRVVGFLQKLDDTRRSLLVSHVKTGVRNLVSQGATYGTDLVEQAASKMMGGSGDFFGQTAAFQRAMGRKESREVVKRMLKYRHDLYRKLGTFEYTPEGSFVHDIPVLRATLGKFVDATTWVNRFQEEFFRRAKFDAVVRQGLKERGLDVAGALADPKLIPEDLLEEATEGALQLTYAGHNPGGLKSFITGAQLLRPISTFVTTFPRYMANAATFAAKRNPLGLARLATTYGRQNPEKVLSEVAVGTTLLTSALALRSSESAGEKWYEVKKGDKRYDLRGFAGPFAPYLFAAEAIRQYNDTGKVNFTGADYVEGTLSMNRLTGTAATMLSFFTEKLDDQQAWQQFAGKMAGEWLAGFATPAKGIKDVLTATGAEEPVLRDAREEPFAGPIKAAIPGLQETLPRRISLTTGEPIPIENIGLSGLLGLSTRTTNAVEQEINRLGIPLNDVAPKTRIKKADREMYRRVGKAVSALAPRFMDTGAYQAMSDVEKTIALKELFADVRKAAGENLEATMPQLAKAVRARANLTRDQRKLLEERGADVDAYLEGLVGAEEEGGSLAPPEEPAEAPAEPEARAPGDMQGLVRAAAEEFGLDPMLALAVAEQESRFNPDAESPAGAQGLMQLMPGTAKDLGVEDPFDAEQNARGGVLYLRQMLDQFKSIPLALAAYNAGPARVARLGRVPNIKETRDYVRQVQERMQRFAEEAR